MLKFPFMCRTLLFRGEKCCWYQSHSGACSQTINNNTYSCFPMHSAGIKAADFKSWGRERNVCIASFPCIDKGVSWWETQPLHEHRSPVDVKDPTPSRR